MPQINPTANITASNILVGFCDLYIAPLATAAPAATKVLGVAWPSGWVSPGSTTEGVTFSRDPKTQDITIEEQSTPVLRLLDTVDITITTTLSEDTITNMLTAYGAGSVASTAATTALAGYSTLTLSDNITELMVGFEAMNAVTGCARLVVIPICTMTAKVDTVYRRAKAQRSYNLTATALCPQSSILIYEQTALPT